MIKKFHLIFFIMCIFSFASFSQVGIGVHVTTVVHGVIGDWQLFISREKQ